MKRQAKRTSQLIEQLTTDLTPVRRPLSLLSLLALVLGFVGLIFAAWLLIDPPYSQPWATTDITSLFKTFGPMLVAGLLAGLAALALSRPDTRLVKPAIAMIISALVVWGWLVLLQLRGANWQSILTILRGDPLGPGCFLSITAAGLVFMGVMWFVLSKAFPLYPRLIAVATALFAGSLAVVGRLLICPVLDQNWLLITHFSPFLFFVPLAVWLMPKFLRP
jgi:hypothetical protein